MSYWNVLLVLLECPAIPVSTGKAGHLAGQTGHLVTLPGRGGKISFVNKKITDIK